MRITVAGSAGFVVDGTTTHKPGSKWMPQPGLPLVTSFTDWVYGTPFKKISPWPGNMARLGTVPKLGEKVKVSLVMLSCRILSFGGCGGGGFNGLGSTVGVVPPLGRKMVLNPGPLHVPTNADKGPSGGGGTGLLHVLVVTVLMSFSFG